MSATATPVRSRSLMTRDALLRSGGGIHADQNRRKDSKRSRTDIRKNLRAGRYDAC